MDNQILYFVGFLLAYVCVILIMELLHRKWGIKAEYTRKIAHAGATLSSLLFLLVFDSWWYVLALGAIFFVVFFIGRQYKIFKSLDSVSRKTSGTYLLPLAVFLVFFIAKQANNQMFFILPILIVGISDPLAGFFGSTYEHKTSKIKFFKWNFEKTFLGSLVFLTSSSLISLSVLSHYGFSGNELLLMTLWVTLIATTTEMLSEHGFDNITVPMAVVALLYFI